MAKVFSVPKEIGPAPDFDYTKPYEEHTRATEAYIKSVVAWAKKYGKGPNAGEMLYFPVGDGNAQYVVYGPTSLIHLPVGDAWQFPYAHLLTAKAIVTEVRRIKAFDELFAKHQHKVDGAKSKRSR